MFPCSTTLSLVVVAPPPRLHQHTGDGRRPTGAPSPPSYAKAVDLTALKDLFPRQKKRPLVNSPGLCDSAARNPTMVVSMTVNVELFNNTGIAWANHTTVRRLACRRTRRRTRSRNRRVLENAQT